MRRIDSKFHVEGDQIVKTTNGEVLPEDEPLLLIRARDHLALDLLDHCILLSKADGCTDYHLEGARHAISKFAESAALHPERMKQPGITRGL